MLALILTSLPSYLLRKRRQPLVSGEIPETVASVYKAAAGIHYAVRNLLASGHPACLHDRVLAAEDLYTYVEQQRLLFSKSGRVCSGPRRLIVNFMEHLIEGSKQKPAEFSFDSSELDSAFVYGLENARLEIETMRHCLAMAEVAKNHMEADATLKPILKEVLSAYLPQTTPHAASCVHRDQLLQDLEERYWPARPFPGFGVQTADETPGEVTNLVATSLGNVPTASLEAMAGYLHVERKALRIFRHRKNAIDRSLSQVRSNVLQPQHLQHRVVGRYGDFLSKTLGLPQKERDLLVLEPHEGIAISGPNAAGSTT